MGTKITSMSAGAIDPILQSKRVFFRPTSTTDIIKVGQLVCYNSDVQQDHKGRSSNPVDDHLGGAGTTYAEGAQTYTSRLFCVEKPKEANVRQFAGVVKCLGPKAGANGDMIEIWTLNGGVVPVYVDATCVLDETIIGVLAGSYTGASYVLDGSNYCQNKADSNPMAIGIAMESVDRDTDNGLVWVRLFNEVGIGPYTAYFTPIRATSTLQGYAMGVNIDGTKLLRGTAASKSYVLNIEGDKEEAYPATGDSNDAMLKIGGSNYAENGVTFVFRGINCNAANRSPGIVGLLTNLISVSLKSGSTTITAIGLQVSCQHQAGADNPDELGGLDVVVNFEGGEATLEYGVKIRTTGNCNVTVDHALYFSKDGTYGFTNLIAADVANTIGASEYAVANGNHGAFDGDAIIYQIKCLIGTDTVYLLAGTPHTQSD